MNPQIEKLLENARAALEYAGELTEGFIDKSKMQIEINKVKNELKSHYERLGNVVYDGRLANRTNDELVERILRDIKELQGDLKKMYEYVGESDRIECPSCGRMNSRGGLYCARCHKKL